MFKRPRLWSTSLTLTTAPALSLWLSSGPAVLPFSTILELSISLLSSFLVLHFSTLIYFSFCWSCCSAWSQAKRVYKSKLSGPKTPSFCLQKVPSLAWTDSGLEGISPPLGRHCSLSPGLSTGEKPHCCPLCVTSPTSSSLCSWCSDNSRLSTWPWVSFLHNAFTPVIYDLGTESLSSVFNW